MHTASQAKEAMRKVKALCGKRCGTCRTARKFAIIDTQVTGPRRFEIRVICQCGTRTFNSGK